MCTVVIDVAADGPVRLLAVRDEDPQREWDRLGGWWPQTHPGVIGIRDRRAGGAWLAANPAERRLAVLLNRAEEHPLPEHGVRSRGFLTLDAVTGLAPAAQPRTHGFNLVDIGPEGARLISWNGAERTETPIPPGVHMIAHDGLDDPTTARIAQWLPRFRKTPTDAAEHPWWHDWIGLLAESSEMPNADDRAIIRDNRPHGYPTLSLLYCVAEVSAEGIVVRDHPLPRPGHFPDDPAAR